MIPCCKEASQILFIISIVFIVYIIVHFQPLQLLLLGFSFHISRSTCIQRVSSRPDPKEVDGPLLHGSKCKKSKRTFSFLF